MRDEMEDNEKKRYIRSKRYKMMIKGNIEYIDRKKFKKPN